MRDEPFVDQRVEQMLDQWGRDYRLDWVELLGHQSKNILYDLIKFQGKIPKVQGYKPIAISPDSDRIERLVSQLYKFNPKAATCLRLLHCARGTIRSKAEMAAEALNTSISQATFKTMIRMGQMYVWGALNESSTK